MYLVTSILRKYLVLPGHDSGLMSLYYSCSHAPFALFYMFSLLRLVLRAGAGQHSLYPLCSEDAPT